MRPLTVGLGTLPGEARATGVDFSTRGRRIDEAIEVLRLLWEGDDKGVSFDGEFFGFDKVTSYPKPTESPATPAPWSTRDGGRSTCPPSGSRPSPRKA
ncbi:LLM class flavin-dependent oxidoreductase [Nonomuraea sp. NPDC026600]|uniref:LLM class flavin-dependent oxidoreductase n=1 Tax=Nonomuraea sp. NPDC026600 TaxID=3155363 RepID=UPI003406E956